MSDTNTVVSTPPAAPQPAPATEVPVNESPVTQQTPLGSQAPPKPEGQDSRQNSNLARRETIAKAFERSKQAQQEAEKSAAQKPRSPDGEKAADAPQRPQQHREQGRFARDPAKTEQLQLPLDQQQQQQAAQQPKPLDQNAPFREPPPRFSDQAKQEWATAPESVRGAVHQMAREFQAGYERYRGDVEAMRELRPYYDLAQSQGTTLPKALSNYISIENKIRQDVFGGFDTITRNLNMKHPDGSPVTFRDVAYHYLSQSPERHQMTAQQNQQTATQHQIGQLYQTVQQLAQGFGQMQYERQFNSNLSKVDKFAEAHPRFDELAPLIKQELDLGFPLEVAYQRAELLRPTQAAQTRNTSAQTRRTSISGAPDGGNSVTTSPSDGRARKNGEDKHPTRREALAKAARRVSGGM